MLGPRTFQGNESRLYTLMPTSRAYSCLWPALEDLKLAEMGVLPHLVMKVSKYSEANGTLVSLLQTWGFSREA